MPYFAYVYVYACVYIYTKNILYILKIARAECSIRNSLVYIFNFTKEDTLTKGSQGSYRGETPTYIYTEVAQLLGKTEMQAVEYNLLSPPPRLPPPCIMRTVFPRRNSDSQHSQLLPCESGCFSPQTSLYK